MMPQRAIWLRTTSGWSPRRCSRCLASLRLPGASGAVSPRLPRADLRRARYSDKRTPRGQLGLAPQPTPRDAAEGVRPRRGRGRATRRADITGARAAPRPGGPAPRLWPCSPVPLQPSRRVPSRTLALVSLGGGSRRGRYLREVGALALHRECEPSPRGGRLGA
jgi:hypothetical protein